MKNRKVIFIIILLLLSFSNVYALELVSCELSEDYKKWLELSDEEKKNHDVPIMCISESSKIDSKLGLSFFKNTMDIVKETAYPSSYSSVENGYVTSVKNQNPTGTCWIYSTNAILESYLLKKYNKEYDLSEIHMEYLSTRSGFLDSYTNDYGYNRLLNTGGNYLMASSYLFNHFGSILETNMKTDDYKDYDRRTIKSIKYSDIVTDDAVIDVDTFEYVNSGVYGTCSVDAIKDIKEYVLNNGSVGVNILSDNNYFTADEDYTYYNYSDLTRSTGEGHAVVIVGWNDQISKDKFLNATRDGAWLVKNSWGTSWGDNGYFYISYDDINVCSSYSIFKTNDKNIYDYTYKSSYLALNMSLGLPATSFVGATPYVITTFKKQTNKPEYFDKVSLSIVAGSTYDVYYINDLSTINTNASIQSWQYLGTVSSEKNGIQTLKLSNEIEITGDYAIAYTGLRPVDNSFSFMTACKTTSPTDAYYNLKVDNNSNSDLSIARKSILAVAINSNKTIAQSIDLKDQYDGCSSSIYVYSYSKGVKEIVSAVPDKSKVYSNSRDGFTLNLKLSNYFIDKSATISTTVKDMSENDYTSSFTYDYSLGKNIVKLKLNKNIVPGDYIVTVKSNFGASASKVIHFDEMVTSSSQDIVVDNYKNFVLVDIYDTKKNKIMLKNLKNKIVSESVVNFKNNNNETLSNDDSTIGTNYKISIGSTEYKVILRGDTNSDNKVSALDYVRVRKNLNAVNKDYITDQTELEASDVNGDGKLSALDYVRLRKLIRNLDVEE